MARGRRWKLLFAAFIGGCCLITYLLFFHSDATGLQLKGAISNVLSRRFPVHQLESWSDHLTVSSPKPFLNSATRTESYNNNVLIPELFNVSKAAALLRSVPENQLRLQRLHEQCTRHGRDQYLLPKNDRENLYYFIAEDRHKLLHCFIPKVATSTMKRVFSILGNRSLGQGLFNMSGRWIHRRKDAYIWVAEAMKAKSGGLDLSSFVRRFDMVSTFTKTLFVRDPYERLFSAYIDRIYGFVDDLEAMARQIMGGVTLKKNLCAFVNPTFKKVMELAVEAPQASMNEHLATFYSLCFPCHLNYDYVGKMETLRRDMENILQAHGVDPQEVLGEESQFQGSHELSVMRDIVKRAFEILGVNKRVQTCFKTFGVLKRTWLEFQVRGYLPVQDPFPLSEQEAKTVSAKTFMQLVDKAYQGVQDRQAVRKQRDLAVSEAFHSLPRPLLYKLQAVLQKDCDLFGYDCSVDTRFNTSERPEPVFHL